MLQAVVQGLRFFRRAVQLRKGCNEPAALPIDLGSELETMQRAQDSGLSWLVAACIVQGVTPKALPLSGSECEAIVKELADLQQRSPLEVYALCLETLAGDVVAATGVPECSGDGDVASQS